MISTGAMDSHATPHEQLDVNMEPVGTIGTLGPRNPLPQVVIPTSIFYGTGFVIHGLGFQFSNGTRTGLVLEDGQEHVDLHDNFRLPHRANQTM